MKEEKHESCAICGYYAHSTKEHIEERNDTYRNIAIMAISLIAFVVVLQIASLIDQNNFWFKFITIYTIGFDSATIIYFAISYKLNMRFKDMEIGYIRGESH